MSIFRTKPSAISSEIIDRIAFGPQPIKKEDWGRIEYSSAWKKQKDMLLLRQKNLIGDTIIFCEHNPVITLGRGSKREEQTLPDNIPVIEVERGGLATYHGPGQLVGYPIMKLSPKIESRFPGGLHEYIRKTENALINFLKPFGIVAQRIEGKTGVWVDGKRKIASIGVAVSHWVTYHGFSLNVSTGPEAWSGFHPCGFDSSVMTDMQGELKREDLSLEDLKAPLLTALKKEFS